MKLKNAWTELRFWLITRIVGRMSIGINLAIDGKTGVSAIDQQPLLLRGTLIANLPIALYAHQEPLAK